MLLFGLLAREALELACCLFGFLRHLSLRRATGGAGLPHALTEAVRLALCPLILLLETLRELLQPLRGFIDLLIRLLLLLATALDALVLVSQLLTIKLEQVGEVLCPLLTT